MIRETGSNQELGFMKKTVLRLAALMAMLGPFSALAAEPIYGVWVRDGHPDDKLEFYDCAGKLCARGTLPLPDGSPAPEILRKAAKNGDNSWKGDLFNPEDGKTYTGSITYDSTTKLTLSGCLMIFCQSETWTRVSFASKPKPKPVAATEDKPEAKAEGKSEGKAEAKSEAKEAGKAHEAAGHAATGHAGHEGAAAHEGAAKEAVKEAAPHAAPAAPKPKAPAAPKPKPAPAPADDQ
jgi:uncharacterized protein (DUF2147 family)